jgi:adenosine deaminase
MEQFRFTREEIVQLTRNAIAVSFSPESVKLKLTEKLDRFLAT